MPAQGQWVDTKEILGTHDLLHYLLHILPSQNCPHYTGITGVPYWWPGSTSNKSLVKPESLRQICSGNVVAKQDGSSLELEDIDELNPLVFGIGKCALRERSS